MRQRLSHLRRFGLALCILALILTALPPLAVSAAPASLAFTPNPVIIPLGQEFGDVTITWNSGDGSLPEYWVSIDGKPDQGPFSFTTPSGSLKVAKGVQYGHAYVGKLYTKGKGTLLAQATVTAARPSLTAPCGVICATQTPPLPPLLPPATVLTPVRTLTTVGSDAYTSQKVYCGITKTGLGPSIDVSTLSNEVIAGYENYYDPGTDPFPCPEKGDHFYRGGVGFDMDKIAAFASVHGIYNATLTFSFRGDPSCLARIEVSSDDAWESWSPDSNSDHFLASGPTHTDAPSLNASGGAVDLTAIVALQVALGNGHGHFVFIGGDESFPDNNDSCLIHMSNFTLTLTPER